MNLVPLFEEALEFQNYNGTVLSNGKAAVYYIGRTRLADIYNDVAAEYPAENPRILDNLGMGPVYVNPAFDYELVVFDEYNNELFSVKKYLHSKGEHSTANVVVTPSENIAVSAWTVGDVQVYMPYLTGQLGKVYTGIEPIVVNNVEDKISANHVPLGVQDPLYFVQDDEEGCIIGFSGQTIPEGVMSESGLGFENNKITGYNGSAFSAGNEYEAGSYVDITDNTISVVNLPTSADVQNIVDVATSGLMPSGDYLTKESADTLYAPTGNYLTGLPDDLVYTADITGLATTAQLDEKLNKTDSGNFLLTSDSGNFLLTSDSAKFYPMESNPSGYLTAHQSLAGYATEQWVEDKGYLTAVEIPESATWNATTETVSANSAQWGASNPQIPVTSTSGISIFESGDKVYFNISADYAFADDITGKQDTLTFGYHDTAISSIDESAIYDTSAHARINTLAGRISDLSSNKLDAAIYAADSGTFLTGLPSDLVYTADIQDMATTGDLTGKQDITGMTAYATVDSLTAKQDAGSYLSATDSANFLLTSDSGNFYPSDNPSAFITGVDLTPYQTTADMVNYQTTAGMTAYLTAVPDTYLQNTDLSTTDGKVTAISGIPLSAGGDVPEGVMVESGLEYNAVNEISAYNGSAIAQYGAEKQWLVHDDTLVHASNSAQYALGVNLSAVAQLLGVDETVLWTNAKGILTATGQNFVLNESYKNFNKFKFCLDMDDCKQEIYVNITNNTTYGFSWGQTNSTDCYLSWMGINFSTDTTGSIIRSKALSYTTNTTAVSPNQCRNNWEWTCRALTAIVGIGRKS